MYIFRTLDGALREAPKAFNPESPDLAMLEDVSEVLVIGKELVKQVRLVPKPKDERRKIREARGAAAPVEQAEPPKQPKKRKQ